MSDAFQGWRALSAGAAALGATVGMLPGAVAMARLTQPLPTLVAGPVLFASAAVFAGLFSAWAANLARPRGRSRLGSILAVSLGAGLLVALAWVALIATGTWARAFPFPPFFGVLGLGLLVGAAAALATGLYHEPHDWDALDVALSAAWAGVPPGLIVLALRAWSA